MNKKFGWSLLAAAVLICGAGIAKAQDNMTPATPAASGDTTPVTPKHKKGKGMEACKADVEQLCADAKGHKAIHECLDKNADKLSQACKDERAKWAKHEKKHKKSEPMAAPASQSPATTPAPATPPQNQ